MSTSVDTGHISDHISSNQIYSKPISSNNINIENRNIIKNNIEPGIIEIISDLFTNICDKNNSQDNNINLNIQKFFISKTVPSISIKDYLMRLTQFTQMEESSLIFILIYLDRFCKFNNIQLTHNNIHKLILTSMFIAIKFNEDRHYSLKIYAKIGGVPPQELKSMEFYFLIFIKFYLNVDENLYNKYYNNLKSFQEELEEEQEDISGEDENDNDGKGDD